MTLRTLLLAAAAAVAAPLAHAGEWGGIYSAVTIASEFRFEGISASDRQPAVQGYVHWYRPDGYYAGTFASTVDYGYSQSPNFEVDIYAGKNWYLGKRRTELKAELVGHFYPDNRTPGPTFNFVTTKLALRHVQGPLDVAGAVAFVPDAPFVTQRTLRVEGEAIYSVRPNLKLKMLAGHTWAERGQDRSYWEAGASANWKRFTVSVRYVDTDLSQRECGFNRDVCGPALVGAVAIDLPPIL